MRRPSRAAGQAALELIALVPLVVLAALTAWQLAAVVAAGMRAQEQARARAIAAGPAPAGVTTVAVTVPVPPILPGAGRPSIAARAVVRTP